jgi:hypothetical protein
MLKKKVQIKTDIIENILIQKIDLIPNKNFNFFFFRYLKIKKKNTRILNLVKIVQELTLRMKEILNFKGYGDGQKIFLNI